MGRNPVLNGTYDHPFADIKFADLFSFTALSPPNVTCIISALRFLSEVRIDTVLHLLVFHSTYKIIPPLSENPTYLSNPYGFLVAWVFMEKTDKAVTTSCNNIFCPFLRSSCSDIRHVFLQVFLFPSHIWSFGHILSIDVLDFETFHEKLLFLSPDYD